MTRSSELRSHIAEVGTRIADLERQLATLRAHETRLKDELGAIVYPILTIPAEITAEILCHAAADSKTKELIAATSVCAVWRSVALSTPRMWNTSFPSPWNRHRDRFNLFQLWLSRSGSLPLSFTTHVSYDDGDRILALMTRHISRWHRVDLLEQFCYHGSLDDGPAPSLVLHGKVLLSDVDSDPYPKWRSVALCSTLVTPSPLLPTLSNVASLTLRDVASAVMSSVLPYTPAVEVLTISRWHTNLPGIPSHPPIILPLIHTLNDGVPGLLNLLSLPALKNLRFLRGILPSPDELEPFLTRSGCTLQLVHVEDCRRNGLFGILGALPSLLEFTGNLEDYPTDDDDTVINFLDAFAERDILPAVERMGLLRIPRNLLSEVHSAVQSRIRSPNSKLKKLTVELHQDDVVTESLRVELAGNGVELEVLFHDD